MPFCEVSKYERSRESPAPPGNGIRIYYRRYGRGSTKVLLIIGLAGTHEGWGPQVKGLTGSEAPWDDEEEEVEAAGGDYREGIEVCCFDNRGMGRSSIPSKKTEYTTTIMAKDALALLDHLGWQKAHVFGHSMGAMIACKLATIAPDRLSSLALLNVTGGGFECFPKIDRQMLSLAVRFLRAKTPEERAIVDLDMHYTQEYLNETVGSTTKRRILYQEYVKGLSSSGMQSSYGFEGQINACWTHSISEKELDAIRLSGFLVLIIHGRYDIIAQVCHARKLAEKLQPAAKIVEFHGAHLVSHERPEEVSHSLPNVQDDLPIAIRKASRSCAHYRALDTSDISVFGKSFVNQCLLNLIKVSQPNMQLLSWSILSPKEIADARLTKRENKRVNCLVTSSDILARMQLSILYIFGVLVMGFERAKRAVRVLKNPVKVANKLTS